MKKIFKAFLTFEFWIICIISFLLYVIFFVPHSHSQTPLETYSYGQGISNPPYAGSLYVIGIPGTGAGTAVRVPANLINACTSTTGGTVPTPPNNTTTFLRGDCTFAVPTVITPVQLTDGTTIALACPLPAGQNTNNYLTLTGPNHQIAFPSCGANSNGAAVFFQINAGNNSGAAYTGLTFAPGFSWPGGSPYAICNSIASPNPACPATENANQIDEFACSVIGIASPSTEWDCWTPQYNILPPFAIISQASCTGTAGAGCTTPAINTTNANLFIVSFTTNGVATPNISDSTGANTYINAISAGSSGFTPEAVIDFVANPTTNASQTFTTTTTVSTLGVLAIRIPNPALDQVSTGASNSGSVTTIQPGSITPTAAQGIIVAVCASGSTSATQSWNNGLVATLLNYTGSATNFFSSLASYLQPSGLAAINPTCTSTVSNSMAAVQASFK